MASRAERERARQLAPLREQAKQSNRLARRKVNRIRREQGINDLGRYSPEIRPNSVIDRMTEKQLRALIKRTEDFRQRSTQFVPLAQGEVTTRQKWRPLEKELRERRKQAKTAFDSIADIPLSSFGQTIGERAKMINPELKRNLESWLGVPDITDSRQVMGEKAITKLQKKLARLNREGEHASMRKQAMRSLNKVDKLFSSVGDPDIIAQIRGLSDDQFYALWASRDFVNSTFLRYYALKNLDDKTMSADKQAMIKASLDDDRAEMQGLINDVKKVKGTGRRF